MALNKFRLYAIYTLLIAILVACIILNMMGDYPVPGFAVFGIGIFAGLFGCFAAKKIASQRESYFVAYGLYWLTVLSALAILAAAVKFSGVLEWMGQSYGFEASNVAGIFNICAGFIGGGLILDALAVHRLIRKKAN